MLILYFSAMYLKLRKGIACAEIITSMMGHQVTRTHRMWKKTNLCENGDASEVWFGEDVMEFVVFLHNYSNSRCPCHQVSVADKLNRLCAVDKFMISCGNVKTIFPLEFTTLKKANLIVAMYFHSQPLVYVDIS
ncbi:hypothetical protein LXL04_029621 [Taraxacum kok-saghyz]